MLVMRIIFIVLVLVLSFTAAEQVNKSFEETRGASLSKPAFAAYFVIGLLLLGICLLAKTWYVFFMILQAVLIVLQILNKEGIYRRNSWNAYSFLALLAAFYTYAGHLDKTKGIPSPGPLFMMFFLFISVFLAGNIKLLLLDRETEEDEAGLSWLSKSKLVIFTILGAAVSIIFMFAMAKYAFF